MMIAILIYAGVSCDFAVVRLGLRAMTPENLLIAK
jgi:hypothetical protein